jgi:hypothetical protein
VGDQEFGKWPKMQLQGLRYMPLQKTIEAIITNSSIVYITNGAGLYPIISTNDSSFGSVEFIDKDLLALALHNGQLNSDGYKTVRVYLCKLSMDRKNITCTIQGRDTFTDIGPMGFIETKPNEYTFVFFSSVCFIILCTIKNLHI